MAAAPTTCAIAADHLRRSPASGSIRRGSTGAPKGTVHVHSSLIQTAELYARPILGIREDDVVFSAAKLFFAYGLGNALTFPLAVGATAVLMAERPTPEAVFARAAQASADDLLRRAHAVRGDARPRRACRSGKRWSCACCTSARRGAAGGDRQALDRATSAWTSSTASARPRCCTSSCPTAPATSATARPASRCRATRCASSTRSGNRRCGTARSASCRSAGRPPPCCYWNNREKTSTRSWARGRAAATSIRRTPTATTSTPGAATTC